MKSFRTVLIAGAMLATGVCVQAELLDGIRVIVHDSLVTTYDLAVPMYQIAPTLRRQYNGEELQKKLLQAEHDNLDILVNRQLILHEFKTAGYSLPESVIDELVRARIRERYGDEITLTHSLQAIGITKEKFRQQIRDQFIERALREKNVSSEKIIISPHKIQTYYDGHKEEFKEANQVKLRMIMLNKSEDANAPQARKLAEEIQSKLKEGATFAEMATLYSQDSYRTQGGEHGWMEEEVLGNKELPEGVAALKPGETSGVIETPEACWLVLMEDKREAHVKPLSEVRDQIEKNLSLDEQNRLEQQWIEKLKKKTYIKSF